MCFESKRKFICCYNYVRFSINSNLLYSILNKKFISKYKHVIKLFGITENGESVSVNINDYNPYFYIKVPDSIDEVNKIKIVNALKQCVDSKVADGLIDTKIIAITVSGFAAREISSQMLPQPIIAVSNNKDIARSFNILSGTTGIFFKT